MVTAQRLQMTDKSWMDIGILPKSLQCDDEMFETMWNLRPEQRDTITVFGKKSVIPRWQQTYGIENYKYSGKSFTCKATPNIFQKYMDWINEYDTSDDKYNMLLVNWYSDGSDCIGEHRDNEKQLIPNSDVVTISLGGERIFRTKYKPVNQADTQNSNETQHVVMKRDFPTLNNSFMIMGGCFQNEYTHQIPRTKKQIGPRISITMRKFM